MDVGTVFFLSLIAFVGVGAVWFRIARPAIEDYRALSTVSPEPTPEVMSQTPPEPAPPAPSDHRQTGSQTDQTAARPRATDEQCLTLFAVFKEAGYNRDEARAILRPFGVPVDNNLFSRAPKPIDPAGDPSVTVPAYEAPPR